MSIKQVHPTNEVEEQNEFKKGLHSVQTFNDLRRRRIQVREATLILSPKLQQYQHMLQPKISQFTSQDQIMEEEDILVLDGFKIKFNRAIRRLLIILNFARAITYFSKQKNKKNITQSSISRQSIPFLPHLKFIRLWREIISFNTVVANIVYPIYITYSEFDSYDFITIVTFIIDFLFFVDIILEQMICQIDNNNILLRKFSSIFIHNLTGWLIFDILTIIPYKLFLEKMEDTFQLRDYFNLLKLIRLLKYFIKTDRKILYHSADSKKTEISIEDKLSFFDYFSLIDAKLLSVLNIFKNMLILISAFGCMWHYVKYYEGISMGEDYSNWTSYIDGLFWAIQTVTVVGYGNVSISTSMQYNLVIVWLLVGVGFYSFTIGNLAQILEQQTSAEIQKEHLEDLENLMDSIIIPDWLSDQVSNFLTYNLENNSFWNYRKIIDSLPGQLKKYTICFSQQKLIVNTNLFKLDINIASKLLPYMTIFYYQKYETIYHVGSPSMDIYFLITGEVRLCDEQGRSLLNIIEGSIFGEMEILDQVNRKQSAIASKNSIVIIFPVQIFLDIIQTDESLSFEIEQLGLRRKILIKESHLRMRQNQKVRRVSCINYKEQRKPTDISKNIMEKEFKQRVSKESFQFIQTRILKYIFGRNQERKWRLFQKFRDVVSKVMKFNKQKRELNKRRRESFIGLKMINNFKGTTENEQLIIKQIFKLQKQKRQLMKTLKQIINHVKSGLQAPMLITPSPYFYCLLKEQKQQILEKKEQETQNKFQKQQKIKKINPYYQLRHLNDFWSKLQNELILYKNAKTELRYQQMEVDGVYFEIQGLIKSII
ncbi:unnamed protein product [Paramecium primaurelia]|uniref:Cyclic nucleotide-binding domain-containing protein n=1 Tax=Paramecium primaurelia TaxID=5886 RepID=A0A8S1KT90_PARPR|nr:unnamed protein product [Paramecium primaurelia]